MRSIFEAQRGLVPLSQQVYLWCTPTSFLTSLPKGKEIWQTIRMGFDIMAMGDNVGRIEDNPNPAAFSVGIPAYPLTEKGTLTQYGAIKCDLLKIPHNVDALFRTMMDRTPEDLNYRVAARVKDTALAIAV